MIVCLAQFGITKEAPEAKKTLQNEQIITDDGEQTILSEQDAFDISSVIDAAGQDPETIQLVSRLKSDKGNELDALRNMKETEILNQLKVTLDDMKMLDQLFKDKDKAIEAIEEEGIVDEENMKIYRNDPDLLEADMRKGLYFQFISLAVVGNYI